MILGAAVKPAVKEVGDVLAKAHKQDQNLLFKKRIMSVLFSQEFRESSINSEKKRSML